MISGVHTGEISGKYFYLYGGFIPTDAGIAQIGFLLFRNPNKGIKLSVFLTDGRDFSLASGKNSCYLFRQEGG
jgi:hypothetical protein